MNTTKTISEFDEAIRTLEQKKTSWASEMGNPESGMTLKDLRFLTSQIEILQAARIAAMSAIADVEQNLKKYTQDW